VLINNNTSPRSPPQPRREGRRKFHKEVEKLGSIKKVDPLTGVECKPVSVFFQKRRRWEKIEKN
jgi:hypothetical protein